MDNSNYFGNRHDDRLGVNKIGKNIRKSPPHQPNLSNQAKQPPQPQVYNINKNDFRNVVQQLTGSPSHHSQEPLPRPPMNSPNPPSIRLQKIRPPRLAPLNVNRPHLPVHPGPQMPPRAASSFNSNLGPRPAQYGQPPPPQAMVPPQESPISAYMRYLQHSIIDPTQTHPQAHPQYQQRPLPSPRFNGPPPPLPSPRTNRPQYQQQPRFTGPPPPFPSPRMNGPFIPPSPNSQFAMPSPSGYLNLLSPLLSPGYQHPLPLTPNFSFSPMAQPGFLRPGPGPQPPPSPGMGFPSPGFFQLPSPRWRN